MTIDEVRKAIKKAEEELGDNGEVIAKVSDIKQLLDALDDQATLLRRYKTKVGSLQEYIKILESEQCEYKKLDEYA
jgi:hypothetical protein